VIRDKIIICFASGWDYHPTSKHHVMRLLAEKNQVIWVNWHASRRPRVHPTDLSSILSKVAQIRRGPRRVCDSITVLTPCQLPLPGLGLARRMNAIMVRRAIRRVLEQLPPRPVQILSFAPDVAEMVGSFGEELVLYYCVDAFGEFPGYDRELIERRERELIERSDLVVTTSKPLYEAKRRLHHEVHLVQHGVDHDHLSRGLRESLACPRELAGLPCPILGFVGMIGEWVDLNLIAGLARSRPDASIVMIGPELVARGPCVGLANVHFLGARDHGQLPAYLRHFDVGLIPFRQVPLTHNANPIKLYEYLAAGLPVVSTPLPAVGPVEDAIWLARDVAEWSVCCARAARRNEPLARRERSERMRAESWPARLEHIGGLIERVLGSSPITASAPVREPVPELVGLDL
jgi:glycosyltransferase involved in cell wall biosynthesis